METTEINLFGVRLNVEFKWIGKHYPETRETPEENPEPEIIKVTAVDSWIDLMPLLEQFEDTIYEMLYND